MLKLEIQDCKSRAFFIVKQYQDQKNAVLPSADDLVFT